jgi:hypothetical protein
MGLSSMTCSQFSGQMIAEKFPFSGMRCLKSSATEAALCLNLPAEFDINFARADL